MNWNEIKKKVRGFIKDEKWKIDCDKKAWIDYPGKGIITDRQVWEHVKKHTSWWDFLRPRLIVHYALSSQLHLMGCVEEPKDPNWKY
ncbi:MAG: hypothetical protein IKU36_01840 [Bacteroidales bacterium]|nr:hypothetical protein [Bacteroidales bacterium]